MVFWTIFITSILHKVTMADFVASQLALLGISGATYLGFKVQEQKKEPTDSKKPAPAG
jgi:hypothetical protein